MSINVTVNGNPVNIRRGRMVLTDLDQIKKNERDRRRRLRLEQVRQQSKEISSRLLERAKNIAKDEINKLEKDDRSNLHRLHEKKIMEIQQKYQEDMADIGHAHACAMLEPDANVILEEEKRTNRLVAIKRGKEAAEQLKEAQEQQTSQQVHQERLRQVRDLENMRSSMVAKLPKVTESDGHTTCIVNPTADEVAEKIHEKCTPKKRNKKSVAKKSPGRVTKSYAKHTKDPDKRLSSKPGTSAVEQQSDTNCNVAISIRGENTNETEHIEISGTENDDKEPRETLPVLTTAKTKVDKIARYNPEDYTQEATNSSSTDSSSTVSDDSSYFSDSGEQPKCVKVSRHHTSPTQSKVQMYDHSTRQRNMYHRPPGVVEKIDVRNEPSAIDVAREIQQAESAESDLMENRKICAQKRGENATLREKVRQDYRTLIQNLDQFAREERKLKASQIQSYPKDVYMREQRRRILREQHNRKLDHAVKTMIDNGGFDERPSRFMETVVTLAPRESEVVDDVPDSVWQEPCYSKERMKTNDGHENKSKEFEKSREEQILDMLKKVERQKRLLLQEFGADLPNDILSASMRPLFETQKPVPPPQPTAPERPLSPEIRVINMSSCDEDVKGSKKKKAERVPIKKVETAVQTAETDTITAAQDKSIQVELIPEKQGEVNSTSSSGNVTSTKHHPIEPKVTIIRPEADSSESTTSIVTGLTIDIDKQEVKVTPKKKKNAVRTLKRTPSRMYQKSRSMPASKPSSPVKRSSKSLPVSRQSSPKKTDTSTKSTPSKRIDIYVNKAGFNIRLEPSGNTAVGVDASTQSSHIFSVDAPERSTGKPYRIQTQTKRIIKLRDTSDTSTSFASPPPVKSRAFVTLKNNTPILEMLDSSANESLKILKRDVSPVSTPGTPSPRTMMIPSNIPHPDKIRRIFRYVSTDSQANDSTLSSTKNDQSTSTDPFEYSHNRRDSLQYPVTSSRKSSISPQFCSCKNPQCKSLHAKLHDIHDQALKSCPQILKKYEDLQNMCSERIASLTDLIEKVRSEQKGMELSVVSPGDETSLMQLPTSKPASNDLQSVRKLVESIETIHNQLARTLIESQRIIKNEVIVEEEEESYRNEDREAGMAINQNTSRDTTQYIEPKVEIQKAKVKPKIISEEKVNIQLNRFKIHKPQELSTITTHERNSWPPEKLLTHEQETIEKLSREILEQSKGLSKSINTSAVLKDINTSLTKHMMQASTTPNNSKTDVNSAIQVDSNIAGEEQDSNEINKNKDFVPLLAGIPKVPRATGSSAPLSGRAKPPVTLHSGPYRTEIESSGHELSTIVEFDTPDTVNKSQTNIKTPSPTKRGAEKQADKSSTVKSSIHVGSLLALHKQRLTAGKSQLSSPSKLSSVIQVSTQKSGETELPDTPKTSKNIGETEQPQDQVPETSNKKLQCDAGNEESPFHKKDLHASSPVSTDPNNQYKNHKDKITSTSSNSFSGLSGVSEITSTPSSDILKYASSPEEMETALKKFGLGWAITTLKKTREASALSSSSNSDVTPIHTARRMISPAKKQLDSNTCGLPEFSDVSSISIKEASKSTEQAVLLKGRTSTPKPQNSNSNSIGTNSSSTNSSGNFQERSDSFIVPNVSLTKTKCTLRQLESL